MGRKKKHNLVDSDGVRICADRCYPSPRRIEIWDLRKIWKN